MEAHVQARMVYAFAGFRLDRLTRQLVRVDAGGRQAPVALGSRALESLLVLAERSGEVVSKQALMDAVWPDLAVEENNLTVQISALRRALDDGRKGPSLIQTVPGRGYLLAADAVRTDASARPAAHPGEPPRPSGTLAPPEGPSLAVLPFATFSGDVEQEYLADGFVEEVITAFAHLRWLFVIARNSAFTYKGRGVDVRQVGRELGVRYVLEGSLSRSGGRVRLFGQLIEAETGQHIWAKRFEGELADLFALQDELVAGVVGAVEPALYVAEQTRAARKQPETLTSLDGYYRGLWHLNRSTPEDYGRAHESFRRAVDLDPSFASPHAGLAFVCLFSAFTFRHAERAALVPIGAEHARRAVALDPADALSRAALALAELLLGCHAESLTEAETALRLSPNSAWAHATVGMALAFSGRPGEAIAPLRRAMRLSPLDSETWIYLINMAHAHYFAHDYPAAAAAARELLRLRPDLRGGCRLLIAALGQAGRREEACAAIARAGADSPGWTGAAGIDDSRELREEDRRHLLDGLRKAGLAV